MSTSLESYRSVRKTSADYITKFQQHGESWPVRSGDLADIDSSFSAMLGGASLSDVVKERKEHHGRATGLDLMGY